MFIDVVLLILGFALLIKGADMFVDGSSSTARNLKVPSLIIGLTIVAFGTSAPELAVSFKSIMAKSGDLVIGNVIGSNIANILLIVGIASLLCPLKVKNDTVKKELPITILMSLLLVTLFVDNVFDSGDINIISRSDGFVILLFFTIFVYYLFSIIKKKKDSNNSEKPKFGMLKSIIYIIIGLASIIIGSNLVVNNAIKIAEILNVSERVISFTVLAIGTSLPELVTAITSARKGEQDLLIGNVIGSNIFNIGIVLALPVAIFGSISGLGFSYLDLGMLVLSSLVLFIFARNDKVISKGEGIAMLILFVVYYAYIIFA